MSLTGKVAIVTGASSGIGKAVARQLQAAGAEVIGVSRTKAEDLDIHWLPLDLTVDGAAETAVAKARIRFGRLDVLVNAAGILTLGTLQSTTDDDWVRTLHLNLTVPFRLLRASVPDLSVSQGSVVNISSINSDRPFNNTVSYSASKAGLDQLTRVAAMDLAPYKIRVNAVNPGVVVTNLHTTAGMSEPDYALFLKRCMDTHPLGRPGLPEDVAQAVLFLVQASWVTGVTLPVDGGRHLTVLR